MKIVKRIGWFIKEEKVSYALGISSLAMIAFLNLIPPRIIGNIIDSMVNETLTLAILFKNIIIFLLIALLIYGLRYAWRMFIFGTSFRLEKKMRIALFEHLTKMSPNFYQKYRTGDLMAHATNDIKAIQRVAGAGVLQFADALLTGSFVLLAMFFTVSWKMTLLALLPMPFMVFGARILSKKLHEAFSQAQKSFSDMNNYVHERVSGIKVIKAFGQESNEVDHFEDVTGNVFEKYMKVSYIDILFEPLFIILLSFTLVIILWVGVVLIEKGELTTGLLSTFISYMFQLMWPMMAIGFLMNTIERGNASFDRIEKVLGQPVEIVNGEPLEKICFDKVIFDIKSFHYPDDSHLVLSDIDFELFKGQTLGLVGKTGSGKSSLIKLLLREYDGYEGSIYVNNQNIKDLNLHALRNLFGYVPQENFLFSMSIKDNIAFGDMSLSIDEIMRAAQIADVHEDIMAFENGYDTLIGERGISLSGGQKQRVSIARALVMDPDVLILDDSLSAVDAKTEEKILRNLKDTRNNKTNIIAAHRLSALKAADLILVLDQGEIIERGTHKELIEKDGWYANIYRQQEYEEGIDYEG